MYIIATFRSRNQTMAFLQILNSYKIKAILINTPRQATVSCGVSVKMPASAFSVAKNILARRKFDTFVGFYSIVEGPPKTVKPIY